ncbi:DNA-directed RNA polymerase specialized sigma subunit, sigma24 family [Actinosynnema pretiosum]|nr:DNA-directed RNA polymerase specialized sigma subunit, sigma24 family [Actinosynnema pretiosum]
MGEERGRGVPWEGLRGVELHEACLVAARGGDHRGLDVLIAELTPLVWHVARGHGLDRVTAADVVQAVWLALRHNLERVPQARALAGWLVVAARREARRVEGRDAAHLLDVELSGVTRGRDRRLWRAFRGLPRQCQELLRLTVLAGRTEYRGLAEALSSPRGGPTRGGCLKALRDGLDAEENAELGIGGPEDTGLESAEWETSGWETAGREGPGNAGRQGAGPEGAGPQGAGWESAERGAGRASRIVLRPEGGALVGTAFEVDFTFVAEPPDLDRLPAPEPIRVLLHVDDALVHPLTRRAQVTEDRDGAPVTFTVTPTQAGVLALVFRVHLERGGRLLQEVRAEVAVREPGE